MVQENKLLKKVSYDYLKLKHIKDTPYDKIKKRYGDNLEPIQQSLLRTGLIRMEIKNYTEMPKHIDLEEDNAIEIPSMSSINYVTTPLLEEILKYTDFFVFEDE